MFLNFMGVNNGEQDCKSAEISLSLCNAVDKYGKKEAGTGEHSTHLITK